MTRRRWLLAAAVIPVSKVFSAASLSAYWDGDNIHVAAPHLHFLTGRPLERLKNGLSAMFLSQLTLSTDAHLTVFRRVPERFVLSYDLWEEKFSVTRLRGNPRSVSHLSSEAAEAWCLRSMVMSAAGLDPSRQFWLRLELRATDPKEEAAVLGEPGINITRLIEVFSRRPRSAQPHWTLEAGPLRLADIRKSTARGDQSG